MDLVEMIPSEDIAQIQESLKNISGFVKKIKKQLALNNKLSDEKYQELEKVIGNRIDDLDIAGICQNLSDCEDMVEKVFDIVSGKPDEYADLEVEKVILPTVSIVREPGHRTDKAYHNDLNQLTSRVITSAKNFRTSEIVIEELWHNIVMLADGKNLSKITDIQNMLTMHLLVEPGNTLLVMMETVIGQIQNKIEQGVISE